MMDCYTPRDATEEAKRIVAASGPAVAGALDRPFGAVTRRAPRPEAFRAFAGQKVRIQEIDAIWYGEKEEPEEINLKGLEQLVEKGQTRFIADALRFLVRSGALTGGRPLDEVLDGLARLLDGPQGLDAIAGQDEGLPGDYVRPRAVEIGAAINRLRGMTAQQLAG